MEIERQSLLRDKDKASVERRTALEADIAEARETSAGMKARWQSKKQAIEGVQKKKAEVEGLRAEVDQVTRSGDLQKAAELRYGKIPELERAIAADEAKLADVQKTSKVRQRRLRKSARKTLRASWPSGPGIPGDQDARGQTGSG